MASQEQHIFRICRLLIKPAIRFALRSSILLQDLIQIAKEVYVELAEEELQKATGKINVSRLSVMTGVHRQDVTKFFRDRESLLIESPQSLLGKVIATWSHAPKFTNQSGRPRVLTYEGATSEFSKLVSSISTTVNPGTVIFELERNGAIVKSARGVKLVRGTVASGMYPERAYSLLARDIDTLTTVVQENLAAQDDESEAGHAHYRTSFDNLFIADLPKVRDWIVQRSRAFHKDVRDYLAQHDADYIQNRIGAKEAGGKVIVTLFSHSSPGLQVLEQHSDKTSYGLRR